tara:strand:+ start:1324 stop:1794 length:471 start_codon:yes stop_codon:yes gene_type:complete
MSYSLFNIPKDKLDPVISNSKKNDLNWENYDECCNRTQIIMDDEFVNYIYKQTKLNFPININDTVCHYVKYNVTNMYEITPHDDHCKITIIVYLNKDSTINDSFIVENKHIENNYWSTNIDTYGCLVMWSDDEFGPTHYGKITGNGIREVLCLFLG